MLFRMLYDNKLAQACYFIGCQQTGDAIIIDPQRDVDRYLDLARSESMTISAITETHIHADFLSGARELAERTGAKLYLSDEGGPDWSYGWLNKKQGGGSYLHQLLKDGHTFKVGKIQFQVVFTPGHTPEHLSFLVTDLGGGASEPMGIASGDFVFVGDVGRPDLLETAAGQTGVKEESAQTLFKSIKKFQDLPDYLQMWPGHGAGSACGKALGAVPQSTVGYEKKFNAAISLAPEETKFVKTILEGQPEPPLYFGRMKVENRDGPALLGKLPEPKQLNAAEFKNIIQEEIALLDTRLWPDFAEGHVPGALFTPLNTVFPTIAGSYVEPGKPIYLIVEKKQVEEAVIDLIHVGLDEIAGYITPETLGLYASEGSELQKSKYKNITEIKNQLNDESVQILDVRRAEEYKAGRLPNTLNIAHTRLLAELDKIPKDKPLFVHCLSGGRSAYATGMLQSHGFDVTQLNGGYQAWIQAGGELA